MRQAQTNSSVPAHLDRQLSPRQLSYRKSLLRQIHQSDMYRSTFAQDREMWEGFLNTHFGVNSSSVLGIDDLIKLKNYLYSNGALKLLSKTASTQSKMATEKQRYRIRKTWEELADDPSNAAMMAWVNKCIKTQVASLQALRLMDAKLIIERLEKWRRSQGRKQKEGK